MYIIFVIRLILIARKNSFEHKAFTCSCYRHVCVTRHSISHGKIDFHSLFHFKPNECSSYWEKNHPFRWNDCTPSEHLIVLEPFDHHS